MLLAAKASSLAAESVRVGIVSKLVSWVQICNNQENREYIIAISKYAQELSQKVAGKNDR